MICFEFWRVLYTDGQTVDDGVIVCLCYVLFSETLVSVMSNISNISAAIGRFVGWGIRQSTFGMSTVVSYADFSPGMTLGIVINALITMLLSTTPRLLIFWKYEL